jgi:hypothetical protein
MRQRSSFTQKPQSGKEREGQKSKTHLPAPSTLLFPKFLRSYSPHFRLTRPLAALPLPLRRLPPILVHFEVVLFSGAEEPAWLEPALRRRREGQFVEVGGNEGGTRERT